MCSILVVEDHEDTREIIAELIAKEGHSYHEAENGQEAIDWLEQQTDLPCLILLDLRMPVMDGWDFLRAIRAVPRWADLAVIVISATIAQDAAVPVLPAKAFWSKPPDQELIASVHQYCDHHRDSWKPTATSS